MHFLLRIIFVVHILQASAEKPAALTATNNSKENLVILKSLKAFEFCSTYNFVGLDFNSETVPQTLLNLSDKDNASSEVSSFFTRESKPVELTHSLIFGAARFQQNCVVSVFREDTFNTRNIAHLLWNRYLRSHLDFMLILAHETENLQRALLEKFANVYIQILDSDSSNFERFLPKSSELRGKEFRVVGTRAVHLLNLKADRTAVHQHGGVEYRMLYAIAQAKNFTFKIEYGSGGGGTGSKLPNGTWVGVVGDVFHDRADFGIGCGTSKSRQAITDVSTVYEYVRLTFFTRTPFPVNRWQALFWSFDTKVWTGLSIVSISTFFIMFLFVNFDDPKSSLSDPWTNLWEATEIVLTLILDECSKIVTKSGVNSRTRFLLLVWILGSLLIGIAYKSKLVSFLTFPYTEKIPETFQELVDAPEYKISFKYYGGVAFTAFKTSQFPVQRKLFSRFQVEKSLQKCIESVALVDRTICVVYKADALSIIASNYTLVAASQVAFFEQAKEFGLIVPLAWAFPKGSPLTRKFSLLIGMVKAAGLYDLWIRREIFTKKLRSAKWLSGDGDNIVAHKMRQFYSSLERTAKPLLKQHVVGPFALLILGLLIASFIYGIEILTRVIISKPVSTAPNCGDEQITIDLSFVVNSKLRIKRLRR